MEVVTITNPGSASAEQSILGGVREALTGVDEALLAVAFVQIAGVNFLEKQLKALGSTTRLVVTAAFGMTNPAALAAACSFGTSLKVHAPTSGTYHPKLYMGRSGSKAVAVIGSANLTGGLVSNVEAAVMLRGTLDDAPIRSAWDFAEALWTDDRSRAWVPGDLPVVEEAFSSELYGLILTAVAATGGQFTTIAKDKPNHVTEVTTTGLYVVTDASAAKSAPAQFVPAWMIEIAWDYLRAHGRLTNRFLLDADGLNVKRSSFVCALLAKLPGVAATYSAADGVVLTRLHSSSWTP
jgi:hypothetical protein